MFEGIIIRITLAFLRMNRPDLATDFLERISIQFPLVSKKE